MPARADASPWSEAAETFAVGALFLGEETASRVVDLVPVEDLHGSRHRAVLRAARRLLDRGQQIDVVTISDELRAKDDLDRAGGMPFLAELVDATPSAAGLDGWARTIQQKRAQREALEVLREEGASLANGAGVDVPEALARIRDRIEDVETAHVPPVEDRANDGIATAAEILDEDGVSEDWEPAAEHVAWRERVTLLAGREKLGKSTLLAAVVASVTRGRSRWGLP